MCYDDGPGRMICRWPRRPDGPAPWDPPRESLPKAILEPSHRLCVDQPHLWFCEQDYPIDDHDVAEGAKNAVPEGEGKD